MLGPTYLQTLVLLLALWILSGPAILAAALLVVLLRRLIERKDPDQINQEAETSTQSPVADQSQVDKTRADSVQTP